MNIKELELQRAASEGVISISDELMGRLTENERVIVESRAATEAVTNMAANISDVIKRAIVEMTSDGVEKSSTTLRTLLAWMDETTAKSKIDTARVEAIQEGMRRALEAVKQTGTMRIAEIDRIVALSESGEEVRRVPGERPEKLSVKRKAAELKKDRDN